MELEDPRNPCEISRLRCEIDAGCVQPDVGGPRCRREKQAGVEEPLESVAYVSRGVFSPRAMWRAGFSAAGDAVEDVARGGWAEQNGIMPGR